MNELKKKKEFRKGFKKSHTEKTKEELQAMSQNRVKITFLTKTGYDYLWADKEELLQLKSTSYLDEENAETTGEFQVHLYYKKNISTT
ncbi:MAG: hypothetical protein ACQUHE_16940 [Bacteroidia bacterium]